MIHFTVAQRLALHEQARLEGDELGPESADDLKALVAVDPTLIPEHFSMVEIHSITANDVDLLIDAIRAYYPDIRSKK